MDEQEYVDPADVKTEPHQMNDEERALAEEFYQSVMDSSNNSARSQQAKEFKVGMSDLGFCSERVRRMLDQQVPDDKDVLLAFIGTALGDHVERAYVASYPHALSQETVELTLQGEQREYVLSGHPDIIDPERKRVVDVKSVEGLNIVRRTGPSRSQQYQRHTYGKAAWEAGYFGECELSEVQVANVWIDRSGRAREFHVQMEPVDENVIAEAGFWLDDVVYAYIQKEEARKEPPREMCAVTCGFYGPCRGADTDVEGLLTDPTLLAAVELDVEGAALAKEAKRMRDEAKAALDGITGSTGKFTVRWVDVGPVNMSAHTRSGYKRLDIKPVK